MYPSKWVSHELWRLSSPLAHIRKEAKITTRQIAKELGVSRQQVNAMENGVRQWTPKCLFAYATMCEHDIILLLAEVERWFSMRPDQGAGAERVAKKLHVEVNPLRVARRNKGLSASEFADSVGCDRFCVYKTETGLTFPQKMTLSRFAEVLDMDLEELETALKDWNKELEEADPYDIIQTHIKQIVGHGVADIKQDMKEESSGDQPAGETGAPG
jgi:transcriptional regulator with XRE-family HTH domain